MQQFLDSARRGVDAALAYAQAHDLGICVLVLDVSGTVCAAARMDGATQISWEIALAKANTALRFNASTAILKERMQAQDMISLVQLADRVIFLGGGVPITRERAVVGAIGVSGAAEEQDAACADAALVAVVHR